MNRIPQRFLVALSHIQLSQENVNHMWTNIATRGNMRAFKTKQAIATCRELWPFCENPVCPDPVCKPANQSSPRSKTKGHVQTGCSWGMCALKSSWGIHGMFMGHSRGVHGACANQSYPRSKTKGHVMGQHGAKCAHSKQNMAKYRGLVALL